MVMKKHRGALSELRACAWLLEQGYEVFRNVSDRGCIDVVALKDGETFYFDVKGSPNGIETRLTPEQDRAGILPLYVNASACWIDGPVASSQIVAVSIDAALPQLRRGPHAGIVVNEVFEGDGDLLFAHACKLGCEGRFGSLYKSGRSPHWLKVKNPKASAAKREAEEDWGRSRGSR